MASAQAESIRGSRYLWQAVLVSGCEEYRTRCPVKDPLANARQGARSKQSAMAENDERGLELLSGSGDPAGNAAPELEHLHAPSRRPLHRLELGVELGASPLANQVRNVNEGYLRVERLPKTCSNPHRFARGGRTVGGEQDPGGKRRIIPPLARDQHRAPGAVRQLARGPGEGNSRRSGVPMAAEHQQIVAQALFEQDLAGEAPTQYLAGDLDARYAGGCHGLVEGLAQPLLA